MVNKYIRVATILGLAMAASFQFNTTAYASEIDTEEGSDVEEIPIVTQNEEYSYLEISEQPIFSDVKTDSEYYEAVQALNKLGIVSGIGDGKFNPDGIVTVGQWALMMDRAFIKEGAVGGLNYIDAAYNSAMKCWLNGWFCSVDKDGISSPISLGEMLKSSFSADGTRAYDYSAGVEDGEKSQYDAWVCAAKQLGLIGQECTWDQTVTRGMAAKIMWFVLSTDINTPMPGEASRFNIELGDIYDINPYLERLVDIPEQIKDSFNENGWTFEIDTERIDEYEAEHKTQIAGLTSYADKTIYVCSPTCVIHEFGHYNYHSIGRPDVVEQLYNTEAQSASQVIGEYGLTNESEYYAEIFEYYILNENKPEELTKLAQLAPNTMQFIQSLEKDNWGYKIDEVEPSNDNEKLVEIMDNM